MSGRPPRLRNDAPEITLRGIALGAAITMVFTSANLYLGLKTGMTFSSSIPAAILSMSLLKLFGGGGILENNIVQTQASAAGTLCNVILVIPGLVLIHAWNGFPLWQTISLCLLGGLFGVAYSVPLRRVLVLGTNLPFPEGVAAAEVLRSGQDSQPGGSGGLRELAASAGVAAVFNLLTSGLRLFPDQLAGTLVFGRAAFRFGGGLSLALIGVGYLVRLGACLALLLGVLLAWGTAVPILTVITHTGDPAVLAQAVWSDKVRLIGAGIIAVGGLWTVVTLAKPMVEAFRPAPKSQNGSKGGDDRQTKDLPPSVMALAVLGLAVPTGILFALFASGSNAVHALVLFTVIVVLLTAVFGFMMASACGYMAGLLGSSSSPISGIGILTTMLVAVCLTFALGGSGDADTTRFVIGFTLFVTSFIVTVSSIANDNLQDLKTGQIVGATPWKQQAVLAIGVVVGAITIAPVLNLLYNAYGFTGALPRAGMNPANAMAAPQAALMTQITNGIVRHQLDWAMVGIGGALGALFVTTETLLNRKGFSLPALTVGIGMYLPLSVVVTIALGGVIGWLTEKAIARHASKSRADQAQESARRLGVLISSGFLVGESLVGVLIALSDTLRGRSDSLALGHVAEFTGMKILGAAVFCAALLGFYRVIADARRT